VVHSRDSEGVGMAHKIKTIFPDDNGGSIG